MSSVSGEWEEIVSQMSTPPGAFTEPAAETNRRATIRYRCAPATSGKVYSAEDHEFVRAWIIDLSQGGIGMQMSKPLEVGRHIIVVLKASDNTRSMEFSARVVHCQPLSHEAWQIGGEFNAPLTPEDLDQFL
jgi:hypothetical protein